jgi:hypothetical protein
MTGSEYTIICGICGIEGLVINITIIDTQILFHVIGAVLLILMVIMRAAKFWTALKE